ncbi:MAG: zinc-ribbon domain-containing protein, partial [Deltaproteobacteria bacterium]|nr:zinc-ribbon domain-containing protein [Deltaproteobacteria bacterium]
ILSKKMEVAMSYCTKCGKEVLEGSSFCKHCGSTISGGSNVSSPPPISTSLPVITDEDYNIFVGKNAAKYIMKFKSFEAGGFDSFKATWHWPAFFVPFWWLLYRKLYGWALLAFVTGWIPYIGWFILPIVWAITANYIYYRQTKRNLLEIKLLHPSPETQRVVMAVTGGVGNAALIIAVFVSCIAIIGILAAIAIPQFVQYQKRASCAAAKSDLKSAYTMAQGFYADNQNANISSIQQLEKLGLKPTEGVNLEIIRGDNSNLIISSKHNRCDETYFVNHTGEISNSAPAPETPPAPAPAPEAAPAPAR